MSKYAPLTDFLKAVDVDHMTLSFVRIEQIIGSALPKSSRHYDAHWRGTTASRPGAAIKEAGWHVESLDFSGESITLQRRGGS